MILPKGCVLAGIVLLALLTILTILFSFFDMHINWEDDFDLASTAGAAEASKKLVDWYEDRDHRGLHRRANETCHAAISWTTRLLYAAPVETIHT